MSAWWCAEWDHGRTWASRGQPKEYEKVSDSLFNVRRSHRSCHDERRNGGLGLTSGFKVDRRVGG